MKIHYFTGFVILDLLRQCSGWISHHQRNRISNLHNVGGPESSVSSGGRSRFNEKILNDAKRLREEAMELEKNEDSVVEDLLITSTKKSSDSISPVGNKLVREEFISRFPIEKVENTTVNLFVKDDIQSNISNSSQLTDDIYESILADREIVKKTETLLSMISEEVLRTENVQITNREVIPTIVETINNPITTETQQKLISNSVIAECEKKIEDLLIEAFTTDGELFVASDHPKPALLAIIIADPETYLVKVRGPNGKEKYEMNSVRNVLKRSGLGFYEVSSVRLLLAFFTSFPAVNTMSKRNQEDIHILKMSIAFVLITSVGQPTPKDSLLYLRDAFYRAYLQADWFRYRLTREVPNASELRKLIAEDSLLTDDPDPDVLTLWRLATIDRLSGASQEVLAEREAVWGDQQPTTLQQAVPAPTVAAKVSEPVASSREKGLLDRLNNYLGQQLESAETDLAEVRGRIKDKAAEAEDASQGQDMLLAALQKKGTLSPAMLALKGRLNSTQKGDEQSDMPAVVAVEESRTVRSTLNVNSTADRLVVNVEGVTVEEMLKMNTTELRELVGDFDLLGVMEAFNDLESSADEMGTAAEVFIGNYFDTPSRRRGKIISKKGAGNFQAEILRDLFTVTSVKTSQGAYIFEGKMKTKTSAEFTTKLEQKYSSSRMSDEVSYSVMMNLRYPNAADSPQQQALDQMQSETPAVVVYPKSWNSSTAFYGNPTLKKALTATTLVSSGAFAASCFGLFNAGSSFMTTGAIPGDLIPLALMPLGIQYASNAVEAYIARQRGCTVSSTVLPSFSLFNFGSRSVFTSMPKNRNDVFDTGATGVGFALMSSLFILFLGLQITSQAASDVVAAYPSVSLTLLDTNAVVRELTSFELPTAFKPLLEAKRATDLIYNGNGEGGGDAQMHLHWLAIAGAVSFISNTLQLIPLDSSAGSRMSLSVAGKNNYIIFTVFFSALRALFVIPMLFNFSTSGLITTPRLLTDYFLTSTLLGVGQELQTARDDITEVSEGRRIAFLGLSFLLIFSIIPFDSMFQSASSSLSGALDYLNVIAATGVPPVENSLF